VNHLLHCVVPGVLRDVTCDFVPFVVSMEGKEEIKLLFFYTLCTTFISPMEISYHDFLILFSPSS
jgi:hypothetical protein